MLRIGQEAATVPVREFGEPAMPDLGLLSACRCFPRYRFRKCEDAPGVLPGFDGGLERVDNVSDAALRDFRLRYGDPDIGKNDIFDYVYGVLHAPGWRERFADDLAKELPRIPLAPNFRAFAEAGRALAGLHLGHGSCPEHPLEVEFSGPGDNPARKRIFRSHRRPWAQAAKCLPTCAPPA